MLVIDATLAGANSNSYVTLANANIYFESRSFVDNWTNSTEDEQNRALVQATRTIDYETFYGYISTNAQRLSFPRIGLDDLDGRDLNGIIPRQVEEATYELAIHIRSKDITQIGITANTVKKLKEKVGTLETETEYAINANDRVTQSNDELPPLVENLLDGLSRTVSSGGSFSVFR